MSVRRGFCSLLFGAALVAGVIGPPQVAVGGEAVEGVWGSQTVRVPPEGGGYGAVSRHARYIAFETLRDLAPEDALVSRPKDRDVYRADLKTGEVTLVSMAADGLTAAEASSHDPSISDDGRFVAFLSGADDLVERDRNDHRDAFVRDMKTGTTTLISANLRGASGSGKTKEVDLSASGEFAVFKSNAYDLVPNYPGSGVLYVRDLVAGKTRILGRDLEGDPIWGITPTISGNGRFVAFQTWQMHLDSRDRNGTSPTDSFVTDRKTGTTELVNLLPNGKHAKAGGFSPTISRNGQYVAYLSGSRHLDPGDTNKNADVYRRNLERRRSMWVSSSFDGELVGGDFRSPTISGDGGSVAFTARADGLTPVTLPGLWNAYVHEMAGVTTVASVSDTEQAADGDTWVDAISGDGRHVLFTSTATNLVPGPTSGDGVYLRSR